MRSSGPEAEIRIPVRTGRVSSREAERATREIVSTNASAGSLTRESPPGSGSDGKSSARSVRRWKVVGPQISSTSCSAARSSIVSCVRRQRAGDVEEQPRRQHRCAGTRDLRVQRRAKADLHVGGEQLRACRLREPRSSRPRAPARRCASTRRAKPSAAASTAPRRTERSSSVCLPRRVMSRGCGHVDSHCRAGVSRQGRWNGLWSAVWKSLRRCGRARARGAHGSRLAEVGEQLLHSLAGPGVGGDACAGAPAGVQNRRVVSPAELAPDRGQGGVGELGARGTWRAAGARRCAASARWRGAPRPRCRSAGRWRSGSRRSCGARRRRAGVRG